MPTVTLDRRGLVVDGRRRWIVSGTIDPARTPSGLWADRLDRAAAAGLNTVVVPVAWSAHEPRQGVFDFSDDRDIGSFLGLAAERHLLAVLRPGPSIGSGWDRGGIPAWVTPSDPDASLRSDDPPFLQASAAWIRALAEHVRPQLITAGGPVVMVQCEHRWFCGDEDGVYLSELARYFRENGLRVPVLNTNNLYATAEGQTDAWNGYEGLLETVRQLRSVRPDQPAFVFDFEIGRPRFWGGDAHSGADPADAQHALVQAVAAGAQFNLGPFAGGSSFGWTAGRLPLTRDAFLTQSADDGAPLSEDGSPTPLLGAIKPILFFSSSFGRVLSGVRWSSVGSCLRTPGDGVSVVHAPGESGSIVFVLRDPSRAHARGHSCHDIVLPAGTALRVDLKDSPAVWCVLDAPITDRHTLDYANASVLWRSGRALAITAPAGSPVEFSINGTPAAAVAPKGKTPEIVTHEGITVAVLNTAQSATAWAHDDALWIGALAPDRPHPGCKSWWRLGASGESSHGTFPAAEKATPVPKLRQWATAGTDEFTGGDSERFAGIAGPSTSESLGAAEGYGWWRWRLTAASTKKTSVLLPEAGDRARLIVNGVGTETVGLGPGATDGPVTIPLRRGTNTITALLDILGRPAGGLGEIEKKGVWGPVYEVKPFSAGRPEVLTGEPLRFLDVRTPMTRTHADDRTLPERLTWTFTHRRKTPLVVNFGPVPPGTRAVLIVNGTPLACFDEGSLTQRVLRGDVLRQGKNTVQLAGDTPAARGVFPTQTVFYECANDLTAKAEWSFALWEQPSVFTPGSPGTHTPDGKPRWWSAGFTLNGPPHTALALDTRGLTKGQVFLNGRNLGRYFTADGDGRAVGGQLGVYLPEPWLVCPGHNAITIFDEYGASPARVRVWPLSKLRA